MGPEQSYGDALWASLTFAICTWPIAFILGWTSEIFNTDFLIESWTFIYTRVVKLEGHWSGEPPCPDIFCHWSQPRGLLVGWLCWGLTSQSTIFQSCRDGAIASWVINQYFRGVKWLAQGHNTAAVGLEPRTSRSGVRHSTYEPPRSPPRGQFGRKILPKLAYFSLFWAEGEAEMYRI